jgi:hypothetical protein
MSSGSAFLLSTPQKCHYMNDLARKQAKPYILLGKNQEEEGGRKCLLHLCCGGHPIFPGFWPTHDLYMRMGMGGGGGEETHCSALQTLFRFFDQIGQKVRLLTKTVAPSLLM